MIEPDAKDERGQKAEGNTRGKYEWRKRKDSAEKIQRETIRIPNIRRAKEKDGKEEQGEEDAEDE